MAPDNADNPRSHGRLDRYKWWLLATITLLALALRLWGIDYGLPYLFHPDEPLKVYLAQRMFKTGDLNPHYFLKPTLFIYLNALAYIPYYLVGKWSGIFLSPADIPYPTEIALAVGHTAMPSTFLLARSLSAAFGAATVVVLFFISRRMLKSTVAGLLAALLLAVSPINTFQSHFVQPDPYMLFFTLLTFWGALGILERGDRRDYIIAAVGCGLAATSKYNSGVIFIVIPVAHFLRYPWRDYARLRNLFLAVDVAAVAFLVGTPYALLDPINFIGGLQFELGHYATGHLGRTNYDNGFYYYLSHLVRVEGMIVPFSLLGVAQAVYSRSKSLLLMVSFVGTYYIFISFFSNQAERTLIPLLPFVFLLGISFLQEVQKQAVLRISLARGYRLLIAGVFVLLCVGWPLQETVRRNLNLIVVDSRTTAVAWIEQNIPRESRLAIEPYVPFVDPERFTVVPFLTLSRQNPEWYVSDHFDYLIFSQGMYERFLVRSAQYPEEAAAYRALFDTFKLVKRFDDAGYEILIYQVTSP